MWIIETIQHGLQFFLHLGETGGFTWVKDRTEATVFDSATEANDVIEGRAAVAAGSWVEGAVPLPA